MRWMDTPILDGRWTLSFPALPDLGLWDVWSYWERERFESLAATLTRDDLLMDVGAEFGGLSAVIALMVGAGRMILVEPEPTVWPTIRAVFEHNGLGPPMHSVVALMSDRSNTTQFPSGAEVRAGWPPSSEGVAEDDLEGHRVYRYLHQHAAETPQLTIDATTDVTVRRSGLAPTALNIDVEGAELRVLRGAEELLSRERPAVWVSVHPDLMERDYGATPADLAAYMEGLGYRGEHLATDHEEHHVWRHPDGR